MSEEWTGKGAVTWKLQVELNIKDTTNGFLYDVFAGNMFQAHKFLRKWMAESLVAGAKKGGGNGGFSDLEHRLQVILEERAAEAKAQRSKERAKTLPGLSIEQLREDMRALEGELETRRQAAGEEE